MVRLPLIPRDDMDVAYPLVAHEGAQALVEHGDADELRGNVLIAATQDRKAQRLHANAGTCGKVEHEEVGVDGVENGLLEVGGLALARERDHLDAADAAEGERGPLYLVRKPHIAKIAQVNGGVVRKVLDRYALPQQSSQQRALHGIVVAPEGGDGHDVQGLAPLTDVAAVDREGLLPKGRVD